MSRVVMFVYNDCRTDARVLREAGALTQAGHDVSIMALPADRKAREIEREARDGFEIVHVPLSVTRARYLAWLRNPWRVKGWVARWLVFRWRKAFTRFPRSFVNALLALGFAMLLILWGLVQGLVRLVSWLLRRDRIIGGVTADWLYRWRFVIYRWGRAAARAAGPADAYHGHDLTALGGATYASTIHGEGHIPIVYDSHEIFLESGSNVNRGRVGRAILRFVERRWVRRAAALVTVNESLREELGRRYRPRRTVVLHNTPSRWEPPLVPEHRIRRALGLREDDRIALYHGGFSAHRGLEELSEAILAPGLEAVHAVFMGYGSQRDWLLQQAADPRYGGRLHVVPAVPPTQLLEWVVDADVGVMPIQASTLNHRLSTPNKLFECLAAGVPVVASDFEEMRRIVRDDPLGPLGELCDPASVPSVAEAIRRIVDLPAAERAELRRRCLAAAHERWNWETESARLIELYASLTAPATDGSPAAAKAASAR
jgi:glycosyltransferase involved in cell wall biosynthesis